MSIPKILSTGNFACSINGNAHNYLLTLLGTRNTFSGQILLLTGHAVPGSYTKTRPSKKQKKKLRQNKRDAA